MQSNQQNDRDHSDKLSEILKPLGFENSSLGVFYQPKHPWIKFDLTAVDPKPEIVLAQVMDMLWDKAKEVGVLQAQDAMKKALGLK